MPVVMAWVFQAGHRRRLGGQGFLSCLEEAAGRPGIQIVGSVVQNLPDLQRKLQFLVHNTIPFAFNAAARVWVAREQWVFTLPSEQPMAVAVSAISISSQ